MNPIPNTADELLLKKFLGVPDAFPGSLYTSEAAGNARPLVFSSQILGQSIPSSVDQLGITTSSTPSQYVYGELDSTGGVYSYKNITTQLTTTQTTSQLIGTIWSSSSYPYIQKVKCTLSAVNPGVSYRFSDPASSSVNYLSQAIPFNFDLAGGTYKYNIVYSNTKNTITQSYYVDTDAGYLYFPSQGDLFPTTVDGNNNPILPIITFYRYNGSIGTSTSTKTATSDTWISYNLTNQVSSPVSITNVSSVNDCYVLFTPPIQNQYNFNQLLPVINNLNITLNGTTILTTTGLPFVRTKTTDIIVQGIHFYTNYSSTFSTNQIPLTSTYTLSGTTSSYLCYNYYTNNNNPISGSITYSNSNFNQTPNPYNFSISYSSQGAPGNFTFTTSMLLNSNGLLAANFTVPLSDTTNNTNAGSTFPLNYTITENPISNAVRFPSIYSNNSIRFNVSNDKTASGQQGTINFSYGNSYPDTLTSVSIQPTNLYGLTTTNIAQQVTMPGFDVTLSNNNLFKSAQYITNTQTNNYTFTNSSTPTSSQINTTEVMALGKKVSESGTTNSLNTYSIMYTYTVSLCTFSTGNNIITLDFANPNIVVGMIVSGTGIVNGTTVSSISNLNAIPTIVLSNAPSASSATGGTVLTFTPATPSFNVPFLIQNSYANRGKNSANTNITNLSYLLNISINSTNSLQSLYVGGFTTTGVQSLLTEPPTIAQIQSLTTAQILVALPYLTSSQIQSLSITQIQSLTIQSLSVSQIQSLSVSQIQSLSIRSLTTAQIQSLSITQIQSLTVSQIQSLKVEQIPSLSIQSLSIAQIQSLTTEQINAVTSAQKSALTDVQKSNLTDTEYTIWGITRPSPPPQRGALSLPQDLSSLTIIQIQSLTIIQIQSLTVSQIQSLSTDQIQSLKVEQIPSLSIESLSIAQIQSLTTEQINAVTSAQKSALTDVQKSNLTDTEYTIWGITRPSP